MRKEYDKVQWSFLKGMIERLDFDSWGVRPIMACVKRFEPIQYLSTGNHEGILIHPDGGILYIEFPHIEMTLEFPTYCL